MQLAKQTQPNWNPESAQRTKPNVFLDLWTVTELDLTLTDWLIIAPWPL
jgi:hypothetical protein